MISIRCQAVMIAALLGFLAGAATAQEPPPHPPVDPEELAAEVASNVVAHLLGAVDTNQTSSTDSGQGPAPPSQLQAAPTPSGTPTQMRESGSSSRDYNRGGDRRSSRRPGVSREDDSRSNGGTGPVPLAAESQPAAARADFSAFRLIAERNIFDPNRRPFRASAPRERPKSIESFSLVGVMSYDKGTFAFFDGTSSAYRKALKQDDIIAGYRVAGINSTAVQLEAGTNQLVLQIGMHLRREDEGEWSASLRSESIAAASSPPGTPAVTTSTPQTDSQTGGSETDILKRLKERRERE